MAPTTPGRQLSTSDCPYVLCRFTWHIVNSCFLHPFCRRNSTSCFIPCSFTLQPAQSAEPHVSGQYAHAPHGVLADSPSANANCCETLRRRLVELNSELVEGLRWRVVVAGTGTTVEVACECRRLGQVSSWQKEAMDCVSEMVVGFVEASETAEEGVSISLARLCCWPRMQLQLAQGVSDGSRLHAELR